MNEISLQDLFSHDVQSIDFPKSSSKIAILSVKTFKRHLSNVDLGNAHGDGFLERQA
jgi:hypothetical protein